MFRLISTFTLLLLACGLRFRRRPKLHQTLMGAAITLDLLTLIAVQATHGAVHKAVISHSYVLLTHVVASVTVLVAYAAILVLGVSLRTGNAVSRRWHRRVAWVFGAARLTNYATSWML